MLGRNAKQFLVLTLAAAFLTSAGQAAFARTAEELDQSITERSTSFYRDFFDSVLYEPIAGLLRFDELWDDLTFRKSPALDVNLFDEVPDSGFFENRQGKSRLSKKALTQGASPGSGPDPDGAWRVFKGKTDGVTAGFFIEDGKGERYLLKFDPKENPEMATSAEVISHNFFHAIGYHVPEYYLVMFKPGILKPSADATYYNEDGFKRKLTEDALWDLVGRVPKFKGGFVRAAATKLLPSKGYMDLDGRRASDPDDLIFHEDRRSIRALPVFGAWLNNYDMRKDNTIDVITDENGNAKVKHYLMDFGSTLGSSGNHPKYPVAGAEHIVDYFEIAKSELSLKFTEDVWEQRWDKAGRMISEPSLGYFNNYAFDPGDWKTQLPYDAFDNMTDADAFWAAKIIMKFADEDIRTILGTGNLSDPDVVKQLEKLLVERRDTIGRYWFSRVTPLDEIELYHVSGSSYEINFKDLSVAYGFDQAADATYRLDGPGSATQESGSPSFTIDASEADSTLSFRARVKRGTDGSWSKPPVQIVLAPGAGGRLRVVEIDHGV